MTTTDKPPAKRARKKPADSLERILELIDERVVSRGEHELGKHDDTEAIADLVEKARNKGESMAELAQRVKKMDVTTRELRPVTRQALDLMLNAESNSSRLAARREESRKRVDEMYAYHLAGHTLKETGQHFGGISTQAVSGMFSRYGLIVQRGRRRAAAHLNAEALT